MSTASAKYQFVGAAQYSRSIALLPRWAAWGHAQPKPGVLDMPHLLASGSSMPASPSARLGMEETKGWVGLALLTMRTPFASSEDNRHSCASPATGVARPGISNTVAKNNFHRHHDSCPIDPVNIFLKPVQNLRPFLASQVNSLGDLVTN